MTIKRSPTYKLCGIDELWHICPESENILASILPNFYTEWDQRLKFINNKRPQDGNCINSSLRYFFLKGNWRPDRWNSENLKTFLISNKKNYLNNVSKYIIRVTFYQVSYVRMFTTFLNSGLSFFPIFQSSRVPRHCPIQFSWAYGEQLKETADKTSLTKIEP